MTYRKKRGSLNLSRKIEKKFAVLSAMYANVHSKNGGYKWWDFADHEDEPEQTLEEAMRTW